MAPGLPKALNVRSPRPSPANHHVHPAHPRLLLHLLHISLALSSLSGFISSRSPLPALRSFAREVELAVLGTALAARPSLPTRPSDLVSTRSSQKPVDVSFILVSPVELFSSRAGRGLAIRKRRTRTAVLARARRRLQSSPSHLPPRPKELVNTFQSARTTCQKDSGSMFDLQKGLLTVSPRSFVLPPVKISASPRPQRELPPISVRVISSRTMDHRLQETCFSVLRPFLYQLLTCALLYVCLKCALIRSSSELRRRRLSQPDESSSRSDLTTNRPIHRLVRSTAISQFGSFPK